MAQGDTFLLVGELLSTDCTTSQRVQISIPLDLIHLTPPFTWQPRRCRCASASAGLHRHLT